MTRQSYLGKKTITARWNLIIEYEQEIIFLDQIQCSQIAIIVPSDLRNGISHCVMYVMALHGVCIKTSEFQ